MSAAIQLGIDVGGSFTDVLVCDASGVLVSRKLANAAHDPAAACRAALAALTPARAAAAREIRYSTTAALNSVLGGTLPAIGLIVTAGFRDLLETARFAPAGLEQPAPRRLVALEHVRELGARLDGDGRERSPVVRAEVVAIAEAFRAQGIAVVAVVLLHSYRNPAQEDAVAAIFAESAPAVTVVRSSRVLPELREYERALATCLNACLVSVLDAHLDGFAPAVSNAVSELHLMQASGGLCSARRARALPLATALSGPAAAVVGMRALGRAAGYRDLITLDIGGTSTDVALLRDGEYAMTTDGAIGGFPLRLPMIDVLSIGAGGGSLARVAPDGRWLVGPASAGAVPGPVCYGRGGREVSLTDAELVLGRLPPALLGGALPLDREAARAALATFGAARGLTAVATAHGLLAIASHAMCGAIRRVATKRGQDPAASSLMAMGGAGPLHGAELAGLLGMRQVIVPPQPGLAAAYGALVADTVLECVRGVGAPAGSLAGETLARVFSELEDAAGRLLADEGCAPAARVFAHKVDLRYVGMMHEWTVPAVRAADGALDLEATIADFHQRFAALCGHSPRVREPVDVVNVRVTGSGRRAGPATWQWPALAPAASTAAPRASREVWFLHEPGPRASAVHDRDSLAPAACIAGPAVIEQHESTTLVPPGWVARGDGHGNLLLSPSGD